LYVDDILNQNIERLCSLDETELNNLILHSIPVDENDTKLLV